MKLTLTEKQWYLIWTAGFMLCIVSIIYPCIQCDFNFGELFDNDYRLGKRLVFLFVIPIIVSSVVTFISLSDPIGIRVAKTMGLIGVGIIIVILILLIFLSVRH